MPFSSGDRRGRRNLAALLVCVILLILYGSLYPWQFEPLRDTDPVTVLLHSWDFHLDRFMLRDIAVNVVLYMPVGFLGVLVFGRRRSWWIAAAWTTALGFAVSCIVELTQAFEPARYTSLIDVSTNTLGTVAGAIVARAFQRFTIQIERRLVRRRPVDAAALVLCGIFAASLLFPFFPVSGRTVLAIKLHGLAHSPVLNPLLILSAATSWYAVCVMMRPAGLWPGPGGEFLTIVPLLAQVFISHRDPAIATFIGAVFGCAAASIAPPAWRVAAAVFVVMIVVRGLAPLHFSSVPQRFLWVPFGGLLAMNWEEGVVVILEKTFYYGTAIWLLRRAGATIARATVGLTILLAAVEIMQRRLPAHTAEITDPLLALLLGYGIAALSPSRETGKRFRLQG